MNEKERPNTYIIGPFKGYDEGIPVITFEDLAVMRNAEIIQNETVDARLFPDVPDAPVDQTPPPETEL